MAHFVQQRANAVPPPYIAVLRVGAVSIHGRVEKHMCAHDWIEVSHAKTRLPSLGQERHAGCEDAPVWRDRAEEEHPVERGEEMLELGF